MPKNIATSQTFQINENRHNVLEAPSRCHRENAPRFADDDRIGAMYISSTLGSFSNTSMLISRTLTSVRLFTVADSGVMSRPSGSDDTWRIARTVFVVAELDLTLVFVSELIFKLVFVVSMTSMVAFGPDVAELSSVSVASFTTSSATSTTAEATPLVLLMLLSSSTDFGWLCVDIGDEDFRVNADAAACGRGNFDERRLVLGGAFCKNSSLLRRSARWLSRISLDSFTLNHKRKTRTKIRFV